MKPENQQSIKDFRIAKNDFYKWASIFQCLGLKPRRFFSDQEVIYLDTLEGWFRLSPAKYEKEELKWLRFLLEYLEERSFNNWALPWQKTIIWEEQSACHLIQPWLVGAETFSPDDPAAVARVAEILADFNRCGKDYCENKGITIVRDRWNETEDQWGKRLRKLEKFEVHSFPEKLRKDFSDLNKEAQTILKEALNSWRTSGVNTLLTHQRSSGMLSHGDLRAKHIVWFNNDYYLLNWENLSFQPRIVDLATLINDVAWWEPDWILFFLNEYAKIQPFWPEEYQGLMALLRYPREALTILVNEQDNSLERKKVKDIFKDLSKKEHCLAVVWKELETQKRWGWGKPAGSQADNPGRISMVCSPIESWGELNGSLDSIIKVSHEQKLPEDVLERLVNTTQDSIVGGRDGNILEAASESENHYFEIAEEPPRLTQEEIESPEDFELNIPLSATSGELFKTEVNSNIEVKEEESGASHQAIRWTGFPKPLKGEKIGA